MEDNKLGNFGVEEQGRARLDRSMKSFFKRFDSTTANKEKKSNHE